MLFRSINIENKINITEQKLINIEKKINNIDIKINTNDNKLNNIDNKINQNINDSVKNIKCIFCEKIFNKKYNVSRHIYNCCLEYKKYIEEKNNILENKIIIIKQKNKLIENKNKLLDDKQKYSDEINNLNKEKILIIKNEQEKNNNINNDIKQLRLDMAKLLKKKSQNINITNNNLMLNINSFGNENLSHITINDYKNFFTGFFPGFIKFIEKIHFDENMPSNHNICITNLKSNNLFVYNDNEWLTKNKREELDRFILKKYNILTEKCCELEEKKMISENVVNDFIKFTKNYQDIEIGRAHV